MTSDAYADDELAALYDLVYDGYTDDLSMYEGFAARGNSPGLELAAGSGRVALHLARLEYDVVAVDTSTPMLDRLRARLDATTARHVRIVKADMRSLDVGERFDLVYIALDSLELMLTDDDALATLRTVHRHLSDEGIFVTELRTLSAVDWSQQPAPPLQHEWTRIDEETGDTITKLLSTRASTATQTTTTTLIFDRAPAGGGPVRRRTFDVTLRVFGRFEIEALLKAAGLRIAAIYGGTDLSPFEDGSDTMVIVAQRDGG